jgi:hypothetical protein
MKLEKLIATAMSAERIPTDIAEAILEYGINELLDAGLTYSECVDVISRAEIAQSRHKTQVISFLDD